jgi:hypothetical protein
MVKVCVFDTETSCLPPYLPGKDWNERNENDMKLLDFSNYYEGSSMWNQLLPLWPSIIQLSYIIYDTDSPNNSKIFNKYIDIPDNVVISENAISVHHIDKEKIKSVSTEKKAHIHTAVLEFMNDIMERDVVAVVGHNVQFDRKMIIAELLRLNEFRGINDNIDKHLLFLMDNRKFTCTMEVTTSLCNIKFAVQYKDKKTGEDKVFYKLKSPKVIESYQAVNATFDYKYIFKTDDDQMLIKPNFFNTITKLIMNKKPISHYGGSIVNVENAYLSEYHKIHPELPKNIPVYATKYCNGRFYFLSKEAVEYLITKKTNIMKEVLEDYAIGYNLHDYFKINILDIATNKIFVDMETINYT